MLAKMILAPLLVLMLADEKDGAMPKPAAKLLTQNVWTLTSTGRDENRNGMIDATEETICECEADNRYTFYTNGTGLIEENQLECGNGLSEMQFCWRLINNDTSIDCNSSVFKIEILSEHELIIYREIRNKNREPVKLLSRFTHEI